MIPAAPVPALHHRVERPAPAPLHDAIVIPPLDPAQAAQRELQTPLRYRLGGPDVAPAQNWYAVLTRWLWDRWNALVDALERNVRIGAGGRVAIGDVLLIAVGAALIVLAVRMLSSLVTVPSKSGAAYAAMTARKSSQALLAQATAAAERGDYAQAVRLLFASAVTLLDLRGVLHDQESATVGDLRRELRGRGIAIEPLFADLARAYTATAYAQRPVDGNTWKAARNAYDALAGAAGTPP